ncbi:DUF2851 family protein [Aquimarina sp. U1-2]|uniref:DUF2851 family protein n=1 Tax=Aquimarina sp. U1-2 TaxID=2823141 RepID=UPI001AECA5DE|nr:DUF2851 family protein [Aquimarina sp. U1-2]MBP2832213.1 DUF2851 family protein [Aquimarina sp. U1-2]
MNEDFIQYLWKYKKFDLKNLRTTEEQCLILHRVGEHNTQSAGPDFFNALISIADQKWAGNVEVHYKSSDWYVHQHETDKAYDNVILHVVWEDDIHIYRQDNTSIPTLQLKNYIDKHLLLQYQKLYSTSNTNWISCERLISKVPDFIMNHWQERLYIERLEQKSIVITSLLKNSTNNWEATLFKLLAKNFGLKVNSEAFLSLANSIDFSVIQKCSTALHTLEALFLGQAGLLNKDIDIPYAGKLRKEYEFLKNKFQLQTNGIIPMQFFRLRPANFPTLRLAQLAALYYKNTNFFHNSIKSTSIDETYKLFEIETTNFWNTHYTLEKQSKYRKKRLSRAFIDLIVINTIIPFRFAYAKSKGYHDDKVFNLIQELSFEKNSIIDNFTALKVPVHHVMHSQALLQLKTKYCEQKACLQCAVGNYLLNQD